MTRGQQPAVADNRSLRLDGERVRRARRARGLRRQDVAERSRGPRPLSETTVKRAEQGASLYLSTARRLAELLEVPLGELLPAETPPVGDNQPTVAVLPFRVTDDGQGGRSFADGLCDDLITRVSRLWFPVISRGSSLGDAAGADSVASRAAASELGATYLVGGSVRLGYGRVRVTAELVEAASDRVLWRHAYDQRLEHIFDAQDELTGMIVTGMEPKLLEAEVRSFAGHRFEDLDAWRKGVLGAWHFYHRTARDNTRAQELLQAAVKQDPHLPNAWYTLALTYQQALVNQWATEPREALKTMGDVCGEFERLYPNEAGCQVTTAYLDVYAGKRDAAEARLLRAIELDPNLVPAYGLYGQALAMGNDPDRSIEQFETALKLSPRDAERWSIYLGTALAHFAAGRYEAVIPEANRAVSVRPNLPFTYSTIASAQAHLGNLPEARAAIAQMRASQPDARLGGVELIMASVSPDVAQRFLDGLKRAGLTE